MPPTLIAHTERLTLRHLELTDAAFFCRLVNEPSWLQNIGDRGVRTPEDAKQYIESIIRASYQSLGFGIYLVESKELREPMGVCGLIKRDALPYPDLGFAFVPEFWGKGYAYESASAVMAHAEDLGFLHLLAITSPANHPSSRLLEKLGFQFEHTTSMGNPAENVRLYAVQLDRPV